MSNLTIWGTNYKTEVIIKPKMHLYGVNTHVPKGFDFRKTANH